MPQSRRSGLALSVGEKTSLILALAMLPFVVMTARSAIQVQPAIDVIAKERASLHYLHTIAHVRRALEASQYGGNESIETLEQAQLNYGEGLGGDELAAEALRALRAGALTDADFALDRLSRQILTQSGLAHDAHADVGVLREAALQTGPSIHAETANLDALVTSPLSGRINDVTRSSLLRTVGALDAALRPLDEWQPDSVAGSNAELDTKVADVRRTVSLMTQGLLSDLRTGRVNAADWSRHFREADGALRDFEGPSRIALDHALEHRGDALEAKRWTDLLWALALLATVTVAGLLALRRTLVEPMQRLVSATGDLIGGDYVQDVPLQARGDEVGAIARFLETFRELAQSRLAAEVARQTAENASIAKSQFIANMSHELRTPLNAIIGYSEIMLEDCEDSANARDLERVLGAARHLLGLINDILDLSKVEAGRMGLNVEEVTLASIVDDVAATVAPVVAKNGSRLVVENLTAKTEFRTDVLKLRQCLLNLLSNAAKFTKGGVIRFSVEEFAHGDQAGLRFIVADTGIGMTRQQLKRLFQPFSQADESITREYGGTGLGLMLTKHIAHVLGGDVHVTSEKGAGSVFTLTILECPESDVAPINDSTSADGPLVLVIDDEKEAHHLVGEALHPLGFRVQGAPNAAVGLDFARLRCADVTAIVLDINLPDRPGWSVLSALKSEPATAEIPVIVLSIDADRQTSATLGAAEHLVKPVSRDVLASTVLRLARRNPITTEDLALAPAAASGAESA